MKSGIEEFAWDVLRIDTGIEFHKNGVLMKNEWPDWF